MLLSIANIFIKRPVLTTVCSILITLGGLVCLPILPIEQLPDIAPPQIQVSATYVGADAETVENTVTSILENQINGVEGMEYITSTSAIGQSSIQVYFDPTRSPDLAQVDVNNLVSVAIPQLPQAVQQQGIAVTQSSPSILQFYTFSSPTGEFDAQFISNYLSLYVQPALARVKGVGQANLFGNLEYSMRLWLDPNRLASYGLTAEDVASALQSQNQIIPVGQVGGPPVNSDQAYTFILRLQGQGQLSTVEQFNNVVLKTGEDGTLVRVKDVGRAEEGAQSYSVTLAADGRPGVGLGIYQLPGSNAIDVANGIREQLAILEQQFPPGLEGKLVFDVTDFVNASLSEVLITLVQAIALVILVIFIFLQDWRTTLIPAIAIPVSLVGTLAFIQAFGFSINLLTLFGLVLATGLVVDDAIVVVESITEKIEEGKTPLQASIEAMDILFGAVIATSVVLFAVFIPVAFFPGATGRIYQQFALTLTFTILISTFNALTFSPAMSALLLRPAKQQQGWLGKFFNLFNAGFDRVRIGYSKALAIIDRLKFLVIGLFAAGLALTGWLFTTTPTGFVPTEDQGYFLGLIIGPEGAPLNYTQKVGQKIQSILETEPSVTSTAVISGFSFIGQGNNLGIYFASLKPWDERKAADQSAEAIVGRINQKLFEGISEAQVRTVLPPAIPGFAAYGGVQFLITDQTGGALSVSQFLESVNKIIGLARENPITRQTFTPFTANSPQIEIDVDRDRLAALNIDFGEALQTLGSYMGGQYVNQITQFGRSYQVYIQADNGFRATPQALTQIYVKSRDGATVPLSEFLTIRQQVGPLYITHYNLFRSIEVDSFAAPGTSTGQVIEGLKDAFQKANFQRFGNGLVGLAREEVSAGTLAPLIFGLGVVVVFLVLAALYESYVDPLIILLTVPLAILGALVFLNLRGIPLDVYAQVGLVMLIGLASKNAILIVDYANEAVAKGMGYTEAALEAAKLRFRPIVMTAISSLIGFFPLVIAQGAGAASRWSLGTVVFGGLLVATVLSLLIVPANYVILKSITRRFFSKKRHDPETGQPELTS